MKCSFQFFVYFILAAISSSNVCDDDIWLHFLSAELIKIIFFILLWSLWWASYLFIYFFSLRALPLVPEIFSNLKWSARLDRSTFVDLMKFSAFLFLDPSSNSMKTLTLDLHGIWNVPSSQSFFFFLNIYALWDCKIYAHDFRFYIRERTIKTFYLKHHYAKGKKM